MIVTLVVMVLTQSNTSYACDGRIAIVIQLFCMVMSMYIYKMVVRRMDDLGITIETECKRVEVLDNDGKINKLVSEIKQIDKLNFLLSILYAIIENYSIYVIVLIATNVFSMKILFNIYHNLVELGLEKRKAILILINYYIVLPLCMVMFEKLSLFLYVILIYSNSLSLHYYSNVVVKKQ